MYIYWKKAHVLACTLTFALKIIKMKNFLKCVSCHLSDSTESVWAAGHFTWFHLILPTLFFFLKFNPSILTIHLSWHVSWFASDCSFTCISPLHLYVDILLSDGQIVWTITIECAINTRLFVISVRSICYKILMIYTDITHPLDSGEWVEVKGETIV